MNMKVKQNALLGILTILIMVGCMAATFVMAAREKKRTTIRSSFDAGVMHGASVLIQINANGVTNIDQRQFMDAAWWSYTNQGGVK